MGSDSFINYYLKKKKLFSWHMVYNCSSTPRTNTIIIKE